MDELKFGMKIPDHPLDIIFKLADYAENSGLDSLWMVDHLVDLGVKPYGAYFTWSVLSSLATKTHKITVGTAVSDPHRLHPAILAQAVMTVDHLSKGRVILGLGAGEATNLDPYGIPWNHPVTRLNETIRILKALWTGEPVTFKGRFFQLEEAFVKPRPINKPHPPIWIAAASPRSMKLTGKEADGWIPIASAFPPNIYDEKLKEIQAYAQENDRSIDSVEPAVFIHTVIDEDREMAKKMIDLPAKSLLLYWTPEVFTEYGHEVGEFHLLRTIYNNRTVASLVKKAKQLPSKPVEDRFIFGTPEDCIRGIKKYIEAGARHMILVFLVPPDKVQDNLRQYVDHVFPEIM